MSQISSSVIPFLPVAPTSLTSIAFLPPVSTATSTPSANPDPFHRFGGTESHGVSSGAIAGTVIGAVAILLLIFTFISLEISRGFFSKSHWIRRTKTAAQSEVEVEIKTRGVQNQKYMEKEEEAEAGIWQDIPLPPPPPAYNDALNGAQHA